MATVSLYYNDEKLHHKLFNAFRRALDIAKKFSYEADNEYNEKKQFKILVDFGEKQPENTLKGYFVFEGVIYRFLTVTFDYALLFPIHCYDNKDFGCKVMDINKMKAQKQPIIFSFKCPKTQYGGGVVFDQISYHIAEKVKSLSYKRIDNENLSIIKTSEWYQFNDEYGSPFYSFDDVTKLALIDIPSEYTSRQYTLVGKYFYSPYTSDGSYCILYAQIDNEYDDKAIKVLRWIPRTHRKYDIMLYDTYISWNCEMDSELRSSFYKSIISILTDKIFELGHISREENEALHTFMLRTNSRVLFGKRKDDKISLIGGIKMFQSNDFLYPICLTKIPIE